MARGALAGKSFFASSSSSFISRSVFSCSSSSSLLKLRPSPPFRIFPGFNRTLCHSAASTVDAEAAEVRPVRRSLLLDRLRLRHLKDQTKGGGKPPSPSLVPAFAKVADSRKKKEKTEKSVAAASFEELGLGEEVMRALEEMGISTPTEIQCIGVPAVLEGKSVVLGSHTGSGKTLAYFLPLVQLMRQDEASAGMLMKPRRPRAVVLCPTRELCEQVFRVAKSISHHARFRSTMISGGGRSRPQEDSLNEPIDMVVGTPGRILQHIQEGNMVYGDIKYLVLDEADTMFDQGFGPDIRKFLAPLKSRAAKPGDQGFQTVLVTATMTKAVQKLIDEEFEGITHLRTSSFQKKVASARHDFIKLSGAENKLEALLQVLEPSLAKGNRVMVFCNTLNSSRAVDHYLGENQIFTVNYHGEVPAEERVENLKKFKSEDGDCPTLVCTDLAARGLDLDVDHVIMFDFPSNSIDYLHRTGRTARMGAKGKVTSLVAKKNLALATLIEEAIKKNESLESLTVNTLRRDVSIYRQISPKGKANIALSKKPSKVVAKVASARQPASHPAATKTQRKSASTKVRKTFSASHPADSKTQRKSASTKVKKTVTLSKPVKALAGGAKKVSGNSNKAQKGRRKSDAARPPTSKLSVVGFRGRSFSGRKGSAKLS